MRKFFSKGKLRFARPLEKQEVLAEVFRLGQALVQQESPLQSNDR